jgi:ankyrin repeat protein
MTFEELIAIVERDDVIELNQALNVGADVNMMGARNWSLLMEAASMGSTNCTNLLIQRGANVNHQSDYGYTPLLQAAHGAKLACINLLLAAGANPELSDQNGHNALMHAYEGGVFDDGETRPCMELLLNDPNTNINAQDGAGVTLLLKAVSEGNIEAVEFLLEHHANFTISDQMGVNPLMSACEIGNFECIRALVSAGAVPDNTTGRFIRGFNGEDVVYELTANQILSLTCQELGMSVEEFFATQGMGYRTEANSSSDEEMSISGDMSDGEF